ncbi:JAB domain-containing protein [Echinicola rosea]|uniref:RadC-like JAB domain-containing protein n=1 Tax=Echinicola rosea TaxID=1807691 RepID=A0ABQ1V582_9BACT|nr:JAB domain-containing protein [Echinicola rosea]GGF38342.1 hypothetical protein GCM10011339_28680 [Echinicola rosea]
MISKFIGIEIKYSPSYSSSPPLLLQNGYVLSYQPQVKLSEVPKITSSKEAYNVLLENWDKSKLQFVEQFKVILLNRSNRVLGIVNISTGGTPGTIADPKLVFAAALKANSSGLIMDKAQIFANKKATYDYKL